MFNFAGKVTRRCFKFIIILLCIRSDAIFIERKIFDIEEKLEWKRFFLQGENCTNFNTLLPRIAKANAALETLHSSTYIHLR